MSGVTLKIASLFIRTLSKPIATRIKAQARDNDGFRRICVSMAQSIHRVDVRLRLGLLQDPAVIERQLARDAKEAAARKAKAEVPTVKTESQVQAEERNAVKEKEKEAEKEKHHHTPRIRPLTESKAIETGANFISETFIFTVALGMLLVERWYSYSKEQNRRSDVLEKLEELEKRDRAHSNTVDALQKEVEELRSGARSRWFWTKAQEQNRAQESNPRSADDTKPSSAGSAHGDVESDSSATSKPVSGEAMRLEAARK